MIYGNKIINNNEILIESIDVLANDISMLLSEDTDMLLEGVNIKDFFKTVTDKIKAAIAKLIDLLSNLVKKVFPKWRALYTAMQKKVASLSESDSKYNGPGKITLELFNDDIVEKFFDDWTRYIHDGDKFLIMVRGYKLTNDQMNEITKIMNESTKEVESSLQRFEEGLHEEEFKFRSYNEYHQLLNLILDESESNNSFLRKINGILVPKADMLQKAFNSFSEKVTKIITEDPSDLSDTVRQFHLQDSLYVFKDFVNENSKLTATAEKIIAKHNRHITSTYTKLLAGNYEKV